jgi:hypothetical protein
MTERQEEKVQGEEKTRGGWRLYELLGLTLEDEERLVDGIVGKALRETEDNTGGKITLEKIIKEIMPLTGEHMPINEAITVLMFYGRQVGHVEYQRKRQGQKGGLADILAALSRGGGGAKAVVVGPDGPRVLDASDIEAMMKGGEE